MILHSWRQTTKPIASRAGSTRSRVTSLAAALGLVAQPQVASGFQAAGPGDAATLARGLDVALSNIPQGLALFDARERLVLLNRQLRAMYGFTDAEVVSGTPFLTILKTVMTKHAAADYNDGLARHFYRVHRDLIAQANGGSIIRVLGDRFISIMNRPLPDGSWVMIFEDVTNLHRSEAMVARLEVHDGLTGLLNRAAFADQLDATLAKAAPGENVALVAIDLHRFRDINDRHGHAIGDKVLQALAQRMSATDARNELIARNGGDEFVCSKTFREDDDLLDFLDRVEDWFAAPIKVGEATIKLDASIGLAINPRDGATRDQLLNNAGLARERARLNQNVAPCLYEASMDEAARTLRAIAADLPVALSRNEFHLVYQAQKTIEGGATTGYEALIRWRHPVRGLIAPADFIPIAEETRAIVEIGAYVLRAACAEATTWAEPLGIAVNLSAVQLGEADLARQIHQVLIDTGLAPRRLELEITETSLIADKSRAHHLLRQIKALGVRIAIDDFGTGYASLDTLSSFPFDRIKIDASFLANAEHSPQARTIIRTIVALGRSLDMPVLAEGVEMPWQLELLHAEGCDEAQGYLLGRPVEAGMPCEQGDAATP